MIVRDKPKLRSLTRIMLKPLIALFDWFDEDWFDKDETA